MTSAVRAANVRLKRVYDPAVRDDGMRILVDRLWPRGVSKADAAIDCWMKELSPSTELRIWFDHDPRRWVEFRRRYRDELRRQRQALARLRQRARDGTITLVFSARDTIHNDAVVLRSVLLGRSQP